MDEPRQSTVKTTPMMQQYLEIKAQYPDALLFYRMGDFYEMFMEDAETAAPILEIALTTRDRNAESPIPMCGVPYHAAEGYIARLVGAGLKVAICDQVEDPKKARGLVRREVTRVITPGLILEAQNLVAKQPNYLAAVFQPPASTHSGLAYLDISTAEFQAIELETEDMLLEELARVAPKEILVPEGSDHAWLRQLKKRVSVRVTPLDPIDFDRSRAEERLIEHFRVHSLEGYGVEQMGRAIRAAGAILSYARANLFDTCEHIDRLLPYNRSDTMILDESTVRNLEIFQSSSFQGHKGSLLEVLDRTRTAMGGRMLRQWLRLPLLSLERILERRQAVEDFFEDPMARTEILARLDRMSDMERINARNSTGTSAPRDLVALKRSIQILPALRELLTGCRSTRLVEIQELWDDLADLAELLETTLVDPPPAGFQAGGVVNPGVDAQLDHYVRLSTDAKSWMADYEVQERARTGISSLKVRYNKVFGYYIEISKANLPSAPVDYTRKQTLVNAERFITEELKTFETQVLEAEEKRLELELQFFEELRRTVAAQGPRIRKMAALVSEIDCTAALAETASRNDYCRPSLDESGGIRIKDGRHPVIERFLPEGRFVPNDLVMDQQQQQVLILTGPNMAGKSTILRQSALIVLMAQIGSYVPASEACIGLVDRIFTRVGASDDLARGRSTFMVEMQETANILHQATPESLIILDEIGRGTSTFDGLSIAWAVAEHLHDLRGKGVKTLFATHYHELTELARSRPRVKNFNVAIKECQGEIVFFHKLTPGGTNRSYGIQVARLAGLPHEVTDRAREILIQMEGGDSGFPTASRVPGARKRTRPAIEGQAGIQLNLFRPSLEWLRDRILALDPDHMTPFAAMQTLQAIREQLRRQGAG